MTFIFLWRNSLVNISINSNKTSLIWTDLKEMWWPDLTSEAERERKPTKKMYHLNNWHIPFREILFFMLLNCTWIRPSNLLCILYTSMAKLLKMCFGWEKRSVWHDRRSCLSEWKSSLSAWLSAFFFSLFHSSHPLHLSPQCQGNFFSSYIFCFLISFYHYIPHWYK